MTQQVQQFAMVRGNITQLLGPEKSAGFIANLLFFISVGSNDIPDHHQYNRTTVSLPQLMAAMQSNFTVQLTVDIELTRVGPFRLTSLQSSLCRRKGANNNKLSPKIDLLDDVTIIPAKYYAGANRLQDASANHAFFFFFIFLNNLMLELIQLGSLEIRHHRCPSARLPPCSVGRELDEERSGCLIELNN